MSHRAALMRPWLFRLLRLAALAAVVGGFAFTVRGLHVGDVKDLLACAHPGLLLGAAIVNFGNLACKSECWRLLLAPTYRVPASSMLRYTVLSAAVSVVTPLRAGEALRVWLLTTRHGVPLLQTTGVALLEKVLDVVSMFITVAPLPFLLPGLPRWVRDTLAALVGLSLVSAGIVSALARWVPRRLWHERVRRFGAGLTRPAGRMLAGLAILTVSWWVDLMMIWAVLDALGIAVPRATALLVLFCVNLAIAVPSTPGQVGALELGAMGGLELVGVQRELGLAFALLYHAIQVLPLLAILLVDAPFVHRALKMARTAPAVRQAGVPFNT
jgi:uncharacterized membrane protein YbhN (UPF0104 family)